MQAAVWFNLNSHTAEILGLVDNDIGPTSWLPAAICKAEIIPEGELTKLKAGDSYTPVDTQTLSYLGAAPGGTVTRDGVTYTDGNYRGVFSEAQTWIEKASGRRERHFVVFSADDGVSRDGVWMAPIDFEDRETTE